MRHSRCEVRDHINYRKNDCCPSYRFCRALQRLKSPMRYICEIFEAPRFSSFSTQSAHDCQSNGPVRPTPRCKKVTPPQLAASYLSGGAQISMGSPRRATFVSGDRTPDGAGMTSSNSFWPPDSVAILVCLSSDDSTISRTRPSLLALLAHRFHRETRTASWRLQEAGFPKDLFGLGGGVHAQYCARCRPRPLSRLE